MSRIVAFGLDNYSVGEFPGMGDFGWQIAGNNSTTGGGSATVAISNDVAANPWLQFGIMALVQPAKLRPWAGVLDTPWVASSPVAMTLYNVEYLASLRVPIAPGVLTGTVFDISGQLIAMANAQEEMYLRLGLTAGDASTRSLVMDQTPIWAQLTKFCAAAGLEVVTRPAIEGNRLIIYVDILARVGVDTNFLAHEGQGNAVANMKVLKATVDGQIVNSLQGIGSQSTQGSRLATSFLQASDSIAKYRLRSAVQQINVPDQATLDASTPVYLSWASTPKLKLQVAIIDVGDAFLAADLGNTAIFHAANVQLPGGKRGWKGMARILAMVYKESNRTVEMTVEAAL